MAVTTINRAQKQTPPRINREITAESKRRIREYVDRGGEGIEDRLVALDREWDVERALEAHTAMATLVGVTLGATLDRRWLVLPGAAAAFLMQHVLWGWSPQVPALRRLGFRTSREIEIERNALKAVRGDFSGLTQKASTKRRPRGEAIPAAR